MTPEVEKIIERWEKSISSEGQLDTSDGCLNPTKKKKFKCRSSCQVFHLVKLLVFWKIIIIMYILVNHMKCAKTNTCTCIFFDLCQRDAQTPFFTTAKLFLLLLLSS